MAGRLYGIRLRLFHANAGRTLIPDERVSYTKVADAYPLLVSLWTEIARAYLGLARSGGGLFYHGFKLLVEGPLRSMQVGITEDDTPPNVAQEEASPKGMPVTILPEPVRVAQITPGRMALIGRAAVSALPVGQVVGRVIALLPDGKPASVRNVAGGLTLDGADVFEAAMVVRLINRGQPRTEFT